MNLRAVNVDGFGCLADVNYALAKGLNIFFGPNEIGKSTLQMALLALLYGFYTKNRRNKEEDELLERFRPWRGEKFGGWLEYAFDDGHAFRVKRDFSGDLQTFLTDPLTQRDLSGEFERGKLGRLDFAEKQLGLAYPVFVNTCFVRQADLHHLADTAQKISETVMNLAETGDRDRSVLRAQDLLQKAFETQVGSERALTKPLERAKRRLQELEIEQTRVMQKRAQTESDFLALQTRQTKLTETAQTLARVQYLTARQKQNALDTKISRVADLSALQTKLQNQIAEFVFVSTFPLETRDTIVRLESEWHARRGRAAHAQRNALQAQAEISNLEERAAPLRAQIPELEHARKIPLERETETRALSTQLEKQQNVLAAAQQRLQETTGAISDQQKLLPTWHAEQELERAGLDWLRAHRSDWQTTHTRLIETEKQVTSGRAAWQARATTLHVLDGASNLENPSDALARFKHMQARLSYLNARHEQHTLEQRVRQIQELLTQEQTITRELAELSFVAAFPFETRDTVLRLEPLWRAQRANVMQVDARADAARIEIATLESRAAPLQAEAETLAHARFIPSEREDEIHALERAWDEKRRVHQSAFAKFTTLENELAIKKQDLKPILAAHQTLLAAPPEKLSVLRAQWNAARERTNQALERVAAAESAWRAANMTDDEFERLQDRLAQVDAARLVELRTPLPTAPPKNDTRLILILFGAGALSALGGVGLFVAGNFLLGALLWAAAIAVLVIAFVLRARLKPPVAPASDSRITAYGFSNLSEMETAFTALQAARLLREKLREAQRALELAQAELRAPENELITLLKLGGTHELTDDMLVARETELREWRQALNELVALDKTRAQFDQLVQTAQTDQDNAAEKLRAALAQCGMDGNDLARDASAFIELCGQRRRLEIVEPQLRALNMQIEMQRAAIQQAQDAHHELERLEMELGVPLAAAEIADADTERALGEYHRHAGLAARARELQTQRVALEPERRAILQSDTLGEMETRCQELAHTLAQFVSREPAFAAIVSTASPNELAAQRAAMDAARPFLEQWNAAENARAQARAQFEKINSELAALLNLANGETLTLEQLDTAENQLRQWTRARQELDTLRARGQQEQAAQTTALTELARVENDLRALVQTAALDTGNLVNDAREFLARCEQRKTLERIETELRALNLQMDHHRVQVQGAEDAQVQLAETERALRELLARAMIPANDLENGIVEFRRRAQLAEEYWRLVAECAGLERERSALLENETFESLAAQRETLNDELKMLCAQHPEFESLQDSETPAQLEQARAALERARTNLVGEIATLETRLSAEHGARGLAEIQEEMYDLRERIGILTQHGQALEIAIEYLESAADEHHRDFVPRLNQWVSDSLKFVTAGRYGKVNIDNRDFQVRLEIPERALPVTPDQLSRGAQEQIYLLLRLGLTELMSNGRERLPLILDDPLVNYDRARLHHALDFLANLASHSQILLFTKDEAIVEWFKGKNFQGNGYCLHWMNAGDETRFNNDSPIVSALELSPPHAISDTASNVLAPANGAGAHNVPAPTAAIEPLPNLLTAPPNDAYVAPPQRGARETNMPRERALKPELICWRRGAFWQIGIELPDALARNSRLELVQHNLNLTSDSRNENRWLLQSLAHNVLVRWVQDGAVEQSSLALAARKFFVFKLHSAAQECGRYVTSVSTGSYMALVPKGWRRYETLAGEPTRHPEEVSVDGYRAHFFELNGDGLNCIAFLDEQEKLAQENSSAQSFFLAGHRILDGENDKGPLFGLVAPRVRFDGNLTWADIQTIEVGQEGRGEGEWRQALAVDSTKAEQSLEAIGAQGAGWYFVRFKDAENQLVDSLDFRFCRGLRKIILPELAPMPTAMGHTTATIEIQHDDETLVSPTDSLPQNIELTRTQGGTRIRIPYYPEFDTTRWRIGTNVEQGLEIVTRVDRVWWAIDVESSATPSWQAKPIALTLNDFDATSSKALWMRLPAPRWAERVRIRLGNEFRSVNARVNEAVIVCALREFENVMPRLSFGSHGLRIEVQHGEKSYAGVVGELRIAARCKKCDFQTTDTDEMLEHVRAEHLGDYFRSLRYDELANLDPSLPHEIYQCNFPGCLYYSTHDPKLSPTSAIHEHGKKHPPGSRPFQKLQDISVIRERVIKNLLDADKCTLCEHVLKHPTEAMRWEHLVQKHRSRLYDRV